ncbi:MAG: ester cyclase [Pseudomonadota bacterium]
MTALDSKSLVHSALTRLYQTDLNQLDETIAALYAPDAVFNAAHPINDHRGQEAISAIFTAFRTAIPDAQRRDDIVIGGLSDGEHWVATAGHIQGTFAHDWLGIPANGQLVHVRYGELHCVIDGRITRTYWFVDLLDLIRQAGWWPVMPSLGHEGRWAAPASHDGLRIVADDLDGGARTLALMKQLHAGLLDFDGKDLDSMTHRRCWADDFMWYGPSGIGTTRGIRGFEAHHQIPFLRGFPDRDIGGEYVAFGDGPYAGTGGWPAMGMTHTGDGWLGLPATGKRINLRVMDIYHAVDGKMTENWVAIDILHALHQLGVDALGRLQHLAGNPDRKL